MFDLNLHAVRPWGGGPKDVKVRAGKIVEVRPADSARADDDVTTIDGKGRLLLPSFSDAHVHLDSTLLGLPLEPHTSEPGIWNLVMNDRQSWRSAEWTVNKRAEYTLGRMIAHGTTRVRSYAQIDADCRLERFEAVLAARAAHEQSCEVQIVAFPQAGLFVEPGVPELLESALRSGADAIGGIDPCQIDRDPVRHINTIFALAEKYSVPLDFHIHEPGHLALFSTDLILDRTKAHAMQGRVTISHGYSLGGISEATTRHVIEQFAELDVAMTTIAPARDSAIPLQDLVTAGVRIGLGEDGQRDYWSPYGNADMLDRTWQLAFTNHLVTNELIDCCVAVATIGGASVMDPDAERLTGKAHRPGVAVGDYADLVLMPGESPTAAVMDRPTDRVVIRRGRIVATGLQLAGG